MPRVSKVTENGLKAAFVKTVRTAHPAWVVFPFQDRYTSGVPDVGINAHLVPVWLELKYANPDLKSRTIQDRTMQRLFRVSCAMHLVYAEVRNERFTIFVEPDKLDHWKDAPLRTVGFDHAWALTIIEGWIRAYGRHQTFRP